jgi:hypothetical protein
VLHFYDSYPDVYSITIPWLIPAVQPLKPSAG